MGRRKVEMKRIEDKASRQVTFSKRRSGLIKKARDLSLLCDVEIAVIVFSNRGRLYEFCSGNSLSNLVERYQNSSGTDGETSTCIMEANMLEQVSRPVQSWRTLQTCLDGPQSDDISVEQLTQLEKQLDVALAQIKLQKYQLMVESMTSLQEQERALKQENEVLEKQIAEAEKGQNGKGVTFNNLVEGSTSTAVNKETLALLRD